MRNPLKDPIKCEARKDCGLLNRADARQWKHWWTIRGHIATLERVRTGIYRCYLTFERETK